MVLDKVKESTSKWEDIHTKENGLQELCKEKEFCSTKMEINTADILLMERNKERGSNEWSMEIDMKGNTWITCFMAEEFTIGLMEHFTKENLGQEKCKGQGNGDLQMVIGMKASL